MKSILPVRTFFFGKTDTFIIIAVLILFNKIA